ncbi:hypothetical protein [Streptomyces anulatus]|uniref:hypothetical protein n=1 Tax=Streptomyces anulatus TaxID=1892 RepID=UPI002F9129BE|nr:hypothetical protein OG238_42055 [Streptomyces anulatus]
MIRTVITCDRNDCKAIFLPDVDSGADVLERAARAAGWRRTSTYSHACPACATGAGPVRQQGEGPAS